MQSFALALCLQDDAAKIETYKREHRRVWPEVIAKLHDVGVERMQIFLIGRRLFMYLDTTDDFEPRSAFANVMEDPKSREWNEWMMTLQEKAPEAAPTDWWAPMERVFDTRW